MTRTPSLETIERYTDPAMRHIAEHGLWSAVANACGISRQAPFQWRKVPIERVLVVEEVIGLPRHVIRPDIYPPVTS